MPMLELGEWTPDRAQVKYPGLITVYNALPTQDGYKTVPLLEDSQRGSLDSVCRGASSGRAQNGTEFIVAGTEEKLWLSMGTPLTDESGTTYGTQPDDRWDFALYGDLLIY